MLKVKPKTKEQTVDYMIRYLSLGTYDHKFLRNLLQMNVAQKKPVTTNQADLLNKIIIRYHRQLAKKEIDSKELTSLPWTLEPIQSSPQYTHAHISINDDQIFLRTPYKKEFVKEIKNISYLTWNRDTKIWSSPVAEFILRKIFDLVNEHFTHVNYCPETKSIIDNLYEYEKSKYWNPTLVNINGNLYIVAANEQLMNSIKHIPLETSPHVLARLSRMGINIDNELIDDSNSNAIKTEIIMEDFSIENVINFLLLIKADLVLLTEWYTKHKNFVLSLVENIKAHDIEVKVLRGKILHTTEKEEIDFRKYEMPVNLNIGMLKYNNTSLSFYAKDIFLASSGAIKQ